MGLAVALGVYVNDFQFASWRVDIAFCLCSGVHNITHQPYPQEGEKRVCYKF